MQPHTPGLTNQSALGASAGNVIDQIQATVSAELVQRETGGLLTASGAEQTLYITEPPGNIKGLAVYVDLDNMLQGDTTILRVYYRITTGGALQLQDYNSYTGADGGLANSIKLVKIDLGPNRFGLRVSLEQSAGVNRTYRWEVFEES